MNIPFKLPPFLESPKWALLGSTFKNTALAINLALASSMVAAPVQSSSEQVTNEPSSIEPVITNAVPFVTDLQPPLEFVIEHSQSDIDPLQLDDILSGIAPASVAESFSLQLLNLVSIQKLQFILSYHIFLY
jgi:hypothetical protein